MGNPFKKLKGIGKALKIGYHVLQKYEELEQIGVVPTLTIKGIPIHALDDATEAFVHSVKDAKKAPAPTVGANFE